MHKDILIFTCHTEDERHSEDNWIIWVGYVKANKIKAAIVL